MSAAPTESSSHNHWNYSGLDDTNLQIHGSTLYFILLLFVIVIFFTTLFFFVGWIYRLFRPSEVHTSQLVVGLDAAEIRKLPVVSYNKVSTCFSSDEAECCICLGRLKEKDEVKVMPLCIHCFHSVCVDKWLMRHSSCPLCRSPVRVDSPV